MAKSKTTAKANEPVTVFITYDLFDLPTAQHKAGLAGLVLQIDSMKNRGKPAPGYRWDDDQPNTKLHIEFTEETITELFDDLYDAALVEGAVREKPFYRGKGAERKEVPPLRRAPFSKTDKKGIEKLTDGYVYLELTPALGTLRHYLPEKGQWVKLWRDLIWQVVREGKKKAPYIKRAIAKAELQDAVAAEATEADPVGSDETEGGRGDGSAWVDLVKHLKEVEGGSFGVGKLSGALLLGAMEKNAETLPLTGRIDHNLLLHFWPISALVFVPRFVDIDGETHIGRRNKKDTAQHFCIAVPEVGSLRRFIADYPSMLQLLGIEMAAFRPRECLVDLPAECAISFIRQLAYLVPERVAGGDVGYSIVSVDYFHVAKDGNNVKFLSTGRVAPCPHLPEDYTAIVGRPGEKPPFGNPMFRRGLMQSLLDGHPWFEPFDELFDKWPHKFFVPTEDPPKLSWFWADARKKLLEIIQSMPTEPDPTNPTTVNDELAVTVNRFVRHYLDERLKQDLGYDFRQFREQKKTPQEAAEARQKLAERLFLEFRSRREQAFISHFSGTFFRVAQYMGGNLFELIAGELLNNTDNVKTLTLMALSANSWTPAQQKETAQ